MFAGEVLESRYRALDLEPLAVEDCYTAVLELTSTVKEDQRLYHVIVENDRGSDRRALMLKVDEPGQVIITRYSSLKRDDERRLVNMFRANTLLAFSFFSLGCSRSSRTTKA